MEGGSETTHVTKGGEKKTKTQRSRSRATMDGFETRLARVELAIANGEEKFKEAMEESHKVEVSSIREELERVSRKLESAEEELVLCKKALAQGSPSTSEVRASPSKLDIPRSKSYKGSRNAKELDNFIWSMEQYFRALAISEEKRKVDMASLFLEDTAMVWWRRRQGDMEKGTCTIDTWAEFRSELKKQFYPSNVEEKAQGKLRRLQHKGSIREYVKEFTEVLLEIPDYPDKEAFFAFMDGLQQWARLELQRRGAQDLTTAISISESLIEFKKPEKSKPKDKGGKGKSGGDHHRGKETTEKTRVSKEYKDGERPPLKCFFCEGPHREKECPKKAKLSALIEEREEQEREEERVGSLQLLNAIKAKVEMPKTGKKGRLFVEAKIGRYTAKALVDTGVSNNFLREEEARKLDNDSQGERGWLKEVNSKPMATFGVARDVKVSLRYLHGPINFSVVTMDDYPIVLGMEFMDKVKAIPIPFANTMCILEEGNTRLVPLEREARLREKHILAMQLSKGVKKQQPRYLVALKEEEVAPPTEVLPRSVDLVLEDFKDVMPPELPKKLPPKREVDYKIELVLGKGNVVADALSRKAELASITSPSFPLVDRVKEGLEQDPQAKNLKELASQGKTRWFWLEDGVLITKGNRVYIPKWQGLKKEIIKECHDSSKYGVFIPVQTKFTAEDAARLFFKYVVKYWGIPKTITDGQTERVNALLELYLRHYVSANQKDWTKFLDIAQFSYNLQKSESTRASPFELATGQQPLTPHTLAIGYKGPSPSAFKFAKGWHEQTDIARAYLPKAAKKMKRWADARRRHLEFEEGDLVMVKLLPHQSRRFAKVHKGLVRRYEGPFPIERCIGKLAYRLTLPSHLEMHLVFHVSLLKPFNEDKDDPSRGESKRAPTAITMVPR
ncbi:unnamed protein product [Cuscuta campestris]|uniref:Uncharacterized protein n=1 Tax=Cuscuta campestris TaxID=132261 RepID=A0A484KNS8_9ASTE|nr:unnamed protein product [Cuscuta campestris]